MTGVSRWTVPALLGSALLAAGCAGLGAAAVIGGITYYKSTHRESATVNLTAQPKRVYQAALETIAGIPSVKVTKKDDSKLVIDMKQDTKSITLKVKALTPATTQLSVISEIEDGAPGSKEAIVRRVGEICDKLGVEHHEVVKE